MPVNDVEKLRKWFRGCPSISDQNRFRVDYLAETPTEYALIQVPSTIAFHENVLGESIPNDIQSLNFIFASKEPWGADEVQNLANVKWYQDVIDWIIEQNTIRNLPEIHEGRALSIVPTLSAHVAAPGADSAQYQIQIKLTYRRR